MTTVEEALAKLPEHEDEIAKYMASIGVTASHDSPLTSNCAMARYLQQATGRNLANAVHSVYDEQCRSVATLTTEQSMFVRNFDRGIYDRILLPKKRWWQRW